jgi:1-acyl-sn-glycerol-3-phosphate acyltransferase
LTGAHPTDPLTGSGQSALRTSTLARWSRASRALIHILRGLILLRFVYPRRVRFEQLEMIRAWSQELLEILRIALRTVPGPEPLAAPHLMVANHISWLDPFVILAVKPARFVGKAEIRGWPLIGALCELAGTLFIERIRRSDAHRIKFMIAEALAAGDCVALFPEGTTTEGDRLLHFHANLLQAAIERQVSLQPLTLRYLDAMGQRCVQAAHVGTQTLLASFLEVLAQPMIVAEVRFLPPVATQNRSRRELAHLSESAIANALAVPLTHRRAASLDDPPG